MNEEYLFEYTDDKLIKFKPKPTTMECMDCGGHNTVPLGMTVVFGSNVSVDVICADCGGEYCCLLPRSEYEFVDKEDVEQDSVERKVYYELECECEIKVGGGQAFTHGDTVTGDSLEEIQAQLELIQNEPCAKLINYTIRKCVVEKTIIARM